MLEDLPPQTLLAALVALAACLGCWWLYRRHHAALQRQLRDAQDSCLELSETASALRQRLAQAALADAAGPGPLRSAVATLGHHAWAQPASVAAELPATAGAVLDPWLETQPLTHRHGDSGFDSTQPMPLGKPLTTPH